MENLVGCGAPLLVAVLVIPILIRGLGTAKYGTLAIAWGVVGYFGFLKVGLDFTLAKLVGERIGQDSQDQIHGLFYTALIVLLFSGVAGGVVLAAISRPLAYSWLSMFHRTCERKYSLFLEFSAVVLPFVISSACFVGTLWAYQRYDLANQATIVTGVLTFGAPAAALLLFFSRIV